MEIRTVRRPGGGTSKLFAKYGERLACLRYRYDPSRGKRHKTIELIIGEEDWQLPAPHPHTQESRQKTPERFHARRVGVRKQPSMEDIMKEFMLLIRNEIDHQNAWSPEKHRQFLKSCETYIGNLKKDGRLKTARPLVREGVIVSGSNGKWKEIPFNEAKEVQVGYYHILANDMNEAIEIAKANPEFEYGTTARIEVRR
jgi:hypothetical protein